VGQQITLEGGARYSHIQLQSKFADTTFFNFPFDEININTGALTGHAGLTFRPGKDWQFNLMGSSGFRAPNVDDAGKVFDSSPGSVMVPNNDLGPEYSYNVDVGIKKVIQDQVAIEVRGFHTWLRDAIVRRNSTFNGADSIMYDGQLSQVQANTNAGQAIVKGFSVNINADFTRYLSFTTNLTHTTGRDVTNNVPLAHIPPTYGQTRLTFHQGKLKSVFFVRYNGWKHIKDYSPYGEDNPEEATQHGTPAWYTLNLRASYQINPSIQIQAGLENILDHHYRPFSSGVSAPGRNLKVTLRGSF
jgi:hemoglobin/transferrin/lactoferrin receptor protein